MINIFCDVIDNFGDAGVCLRLGRDLCNKKEQVNLFCNDLETIKKIIKKDDTKNQSLNISLWPKKGDNVELKHTVIQAFSVRLPDYIYSNIKKNKALVINLEYLTAEPFADDCHKLPSYSDGIESYFFFPGFTSSTGGLVIENTFLQKIKEKSEFLNNKSKYKNNIKDSYVTLFSYENSKIPHLLKNLTNLAKNQNSSLTVIVFEGKPLNNINNLLNLNLSVGDTYRLNNLIIKVSPMVDQDEYDSLLIGSYINLVRGEDSIVRAMLTGNPFLWHIYPQEENAHIEKINALFDRMDEFCTDKKSVEILRQLTLSYNGASDYIVDFDISSFIEKWKHLSEEWRDHLLSLGSLTDNLLAFIREKNGSERKIVGSIRS